MRVKWSVCPLPAKGSITASSCREGREEREEWEAHP